MIPRVRGRVGSAEDGKYYFELSIWDFSGRKQLCDPFTIGPWKTEAQAHKEMHKAAELVVENCKDEKGRPPEGMIDLLNKGEFKPFRKDMV